MTRLEALNDLLKAVKHPPWTKADLIRARIRRSNRLVLQEVFMLVDAFEADPSRSVSPETAARIGVLLGQIAAITTGMAAHAARVAARAPQEAP